MDDFLFNLRNNANNKRHDGNRKPYGGYNTRNYDRQRGKDYKGGNYQRNFQQEYLPLIKKALEEISTSYQRMAEAGERRARAEERQARALEVIASVTLGEPLPPEDEDPKNEIQESAAEYPSEDENPDIHDDAYAFDTDISAETDRDTVVNTILDMRKEKISYDRIAQFLAEKGIPTVSGRGQWRAQAVSRLCRQSIDVGDIESPPNLDTAR